MNTKTLLATGAAAILAVTAFAAIDGFNIKRTPKVGDQIKMKLKVEMEVMGQSALYTATSIDKVTKVLDDGSYEETHTTIEPKLKLGDNEMDAPAGGDTVYVRKPDGTTSEIRGEAADAGAYRMSALGTLTIPDKAVNVGDTWSYDFKADTKTGQVAAHADYKVLGEEKIDKWDTLKIDAKVHEAEGADAAKSDSTIWLSKSDWNPVKIETKWSNVPVTGAPAPVSGTVHLTRVE